MSINFFEPACQEPAFTHKLVGLCDDENGTKAYTDITDPGKWIATVKNDLEKKLVFIAVDKCVIKDGEHPRRGRCDGMLYSDEHLFFVELKNEIRGWVSGAIEQLESTIQFFIETNDISIYKHKKAFACNKKNKPFQQIDNELNKQFFQKYRVRIDVQAQIIVV